MKKNVGTTKLTELTNKIIHVNLLVGAYEI